MNKSNAIKHGMVLTPASAATRRGKTSAAQTKAQERFRGMFYTLLLVTVVTVLHEMNLFS